MKVLVCVRRLDKGGAEMLECRLAQYLNQAGVHADLAGQYDEKQFEGVLCADKWHALGVPTVVWLESNKPLGIFAAVVRLVKIVRKNKYDVVISHHSGLDIIAGLSCLITGTKHVVAFHDYFYKEKMGKARLMIWRIILSRASAAYSISNYVRQNVYEILNVNKELNRTIYNSIIIPATEETLVTSIRQELHLPEEARLILSSGRINYNKGFDLSISLLKYILVENNIYLIIMGGPTSTAEESHLSSLTELVDKLGLKEKVLFIGYREDAFSIMKQCDVYIHMARHEGFGLVLTEAIAAGIPIVASDVGGIPEVLNRTTYPVFSLMDEHAIKNEVIRLLGMTFEERDKLISTAKKALPFFSDERRAEEVKKMLEEIVN